MEGGGVRGAGALTSALRRRPCTGRGVCEDDGDGGGGGAEASVAERAGLELGVGPGGEQSLVW